jgi:drug/metabolite transporter (DMT)-like permease
MKETYGYLFIVVASVIWGTMGILGKLAFGYGIHPVTLTALRLIISSSTILMPMILFRRELFKIQRRDLHLFLVFGIFGVALQRVAYFYTVDLTTATMAAILFYMYPIFVAIYSLFALGERLTVSIVSAIVLTFSGVALVVKVYEVSRLNASLLGVLFGMLSSLMFALYFLTVRRLRNRYTNWTVMVYGDGIGAAILAPMIWLFSPGIGSFPPQLWSLVFMIAWFPSMLAYSIYSYALKHVKSSKGSILSVIEPLAAAIFSATILKERFEPLQVVGVTLALTGVIVLFYKPKFKNLTR